MDEQADPDTSVDELQDKYRLAREAMTLGLEAVGHSRQLLHEILENVTDARSRGNINRQLWHAAKIAGDVPQFFSQAGQDAYLDGQLFFEKRGGVFVEIGGYDGLTGSNCLFFEMMRGWTGLLVEPSPTHFLSAAEFRKCNCLQFAIGPEDGKAKFFEIREGFRQMSGLAAHYDPELRRKVETDPRFEGGEIEVQVKSLDTVLSEAHFEDIDYISLDAEGTEFAILSSFPFGKYRVTAWTVENDGRDTRIPELMATKGYRRIEAFGTDDLYVMDPV